MARDRHFTRENELNFNRLCLVAKFKKQVEKNVLNEIVSFKIFVPTLNGSVAKDIGMVAKRVGCRWKIDTDSISKKFITVKLYKY